MTGHSTARDMDEQPTATYRITGYTVYPRGYDRVSVPERERWLVTVSDTGDGWAVRRRTLCLNYRRTWEFEPPARGRSQDFLHRCRFTEQAALNRARQMIDEMLVDGLTYDEFVEKVQHEAAVKARAVLEEERRAILAAPHRDIKAMLMNHRWTRMRRPAAG